MCIKFIFPQLQQVIACVSSIHIKKYWYFFLYFISQSEEASGTTAIGHPEASESSPPVKKSAMAKLFGEFFKTQVGHKDAVLQVKEEVVLQ